MVAEAVARAVEQVIRANELAGTRRGLEVLADGLERLAREWRTAYGVDVSDMLLAAAELRRDR